MATDTGIVTQGTSIQISADDITFAELGCIQSWSLDSPSRPEIDTTCLLSTSKTFKFGLKDNGTVTTELLYEAGGAGQLVLEASYESNTPYYFSIEYTDGTIGDGTIKTFTGYVISISQSGNQDDVVRQSVQIKIDGDIVTTPAETV